MKRTYKFKLYNSKRLRKVERLLHIACSVYNHCIALEKRYYRLFGKNVNQYELVNHITRMKKKQQFGFWKELNSQVIQDIVERVCRNYRSFFGNHKKNKRAKTPRFVNKYQYKSMTYKQSGYKFDGNVLILQKQWRIKFCKSREIEGKIKTVTIKRDSLDDYWLFVVCDVDVNEILPRQGEIVGLDFGLKHFLTTDNGDKIESPLFFKQMKNLIGKLNRNRSRKVGEKKGEKKSKGWLKASYRLQRVYLRLVNLRDDFQWKLARRLCEHYSVVCIEDISLKGMAKLWGRKVNDLRFGDFVRKLEYMAMKFGCTVVKVGKWFASSQRCHCCGYINKEAKDLRLRKWTCPQCGQEHDRDVNASINIRNEGLQMCEIV